MLNQILRGHTFTVSSGQKVQNCTKKCAPQIGGKFFLFIWWREAKRSRKLGEKKVMALSLGVTQFADG